MRKLLIIVTMIAAAGLLYAADYETVQFNPTGITTNTSASSATTITKGSDSGVPDGKVVMLSFQGSTNMSFKVDTVDGYGMSLGAARAIQAAVTNCMETNIVLGTAVYVKSDRIKASFYGSSDTNGTATATLKLLVEE